MRLIEEELDLETSMLFDIDVFLDDLIEQFHTTTEEFDRLYIVEQFPSTLNMMDFSLDNNPNYEFKIHHTIKVRRKTAEEMTEDVSRHITQGEK